MQSDHGGSITMADAARLAYTCNELADALGCTRQHIQNLIARGELASIKLGRRRLIPVDVVDELLAGADTEEISDGAA